MLPSLWPWRTRMILFGLVRKIVPACQKKTNLWGVKSHFWNNNNRWMNPRTCKALGPSLLRALPYTESCSWNTDNSPQIPNRLFWYLRRIICVSWARSGKKQRKKNSWIRLLRGCRLVTYLPLWFCCSDPTDIKLFKTAISFSVLLSSSRLLKCSNLLMLWLLQLCAGVRKKSAAAAAAESRSIEEEEEEAAAAVRRIRFAPLKSSGWCRSGTRFRDQQHPKEEFSNFGWEQAGLKMVLPEAPGEATTVAAMLESPARPQTRPQIFRFLSNIFWGFFARLFWKSSHNPEKQIYLLPNYFSPPPPLRRQLSSSLVRSLFLPLSRSLARGDFAHFFLILPFLCGVPFFPGFLAFFPFFLSSLFKLFLSPLPFFLSFLFWDSLFVFPLKIFPPFLLSSGESQKEGIRNNELGEQVWREKELRNPCCVGIWIF